MALASVSGYDRMKIRKLASGYDDETTAPSCPIVSPLNNIIGQKFEVPPMSDVSFNCIFGLEF